MPTSFEWIATLPPPLQFAVMVGAGLYAIYLARTGYAAGKKEPPVTAKDMVLTAAGITDLTPIREAVAEMARNTSAQERNAEAVERCADELGTIRQILAEDAEQRQDHRNYMRGLEAGRREREGPRRR